MATTPIVTGRSLRLVTMAMLTIILFNSVFDPKTFHEEHVVGDDAALEIIWSMDKSLSDASGPQQQHHEQSCLHAASESMINDPRSTNKPNYFLHFFEAAPSCNQQLNAKDVDFGVVTQSSMDRVWLLQHHCCALDWPNFLGRVCCVGWECEHRPHADSIRHDMIRHYNCTRFLVRLSHYWVFQGNILLCAMRRCEWSRPITWSCRCPLFIPRVHAGRIASSLWHSPSLSSQTSLGATRI
jgi:hypothetical protein